MSIDSKNMTTKGDEANNGTYGVEKPKTDEDLLHKFLALQEKLCLESGELTNNESSPGPWCPRSWDGWSCWNETGGGETAYAPCPLFITGFVPSKLAHKECLEDGTWFRHPESNLTWSNYTTCVDIDDLQWRRFIITFYEVGYFISVCTLLISLLIFCSFKCLKCTRVKIHKHLFVSFIISNLFWLFWYRLVINDPDVMLNNPWWCSCVHILVQYFLVANYFWMFCEGFYLHTLIVLAFFRSETRMLRGFYVFAWAGPILPISAYIYFRATDPIDSQQCWVSESTWSLILGVPVCLSLVLSLAFLFNILRVLVKKLKDNERTFNTATRSASFNSNSSPSDNHHSIKKAARATLILIPLLGLHYLVIPFRPVSSTRWAAVYEIVAAATSSLQGFCVSLLFCFCNSEVIGVLKRKFCKGFCLPSRSGRHDVSCAPTNRWDYKAGRNGVNGRDDVNNEDLEVFTLPVQNVNERY